MRIKFVNPMSTNFKVKPHLCWQDRNVQLFNIFK